MKKYLALIMAAAMILSILAACGKENTPEDNNLKVPDSITVVDSEWDGIDMYLIDSMNDMQSLVSDSILTKADDGTALPGIASASVWAEDGLTWTLTFPEGMFYSTGEHLEP